MTATILATSVSEGGRVARLADSGLHGPRWLRRGCSASHSGAMVLIYGGILLIFATSNRAVRLPVKLLQGGTNPWLAIAAEPIEAA